MAKFIVVTNRGLGLAVAQELEKKGAEVAVYVHEPSHWDVYEGMLKTRLKTPEQLREYLDQEGREGDFVLFDGNPRFDALNEADKAFIEIVRGIQNTESANLFGPWATNLAHQKYRVFGASSTTDAINADRAKQRRLAGHLNLTAPGFQRVPNVGEALAYLARRGDTLHVLRHNEADGFEEAHQEQATQMLRSGVYPEGPIAIEERIDGITWDERAWYDDGFKLFWSSVSAGSLLDGRAGLTWVKNQGRCKVPWPALESTLKQAHYRGPVRARFRVTARGEPFFLGWRFGFPAEEMLELLALFTGDLPQLFTDQLVAPFDAERVAGSLSVHTWPWPFESRHMPPPAYEIAEPGYLRLFDAKAGPQGVVGAGASGRIGVAVHAEDREHRPEDVLGRCELSIKRAKVGAKLTYLHDTKGLCDQWRELFRRGFAN